MSDGDWCCSYTDENGLWYNDRWSEESWVGAQKQMAARYTDSPHVVGFELRNELRKATLTRGMLTPTWGGGDAATDWRAAAERAGNEILKVNSDVLIFIDGLEYATNLVGVRNDPARLDVSDKLVYVAHDYSWSQTFSSCENLHDQLNDRWGFILEQNETFTAPLWLSEFGTRKFDFVCTIFFIFVIYSWFCSARRIATGDGHLVGLLYAVFACDRCVVGILETRWHRIERNLETFRSRGGFWDSQHALEWSRQRRRAFERSASPPASYSGSFAAHIIFKKEYQKWFFLRDLFTS